MIVIQAYTNGISGVRAGNSDMKLSVAPQGQTAGRLAVGRFVVVD